MYCKDCGAEIKDPETQNFCEKCGSPVSSAPRQREVVTTVATARPVTTLGFEPYDRPGGLFDLNRNYYILKEKSRQLV
ncbi:MAG: hypothetical protein ACFE94_04640 [Candidatus Hodarchaeota archaeon]